MANGVQGTFDTFVCSIQSVARDWVFLLLFPLPDRKRWAPRYFVVALGGTVKDNGEFAIKLFDPANGLC